MRGRVADMGVELYFMRAMVITARDLIVITD